jgi:hypothetical protein
VPTGWARAQERRRKQVLRRVLRGLTRVTLVAVVSAAAALGPYAHPAGAQSGSPADEMCAELLDAQEQAVGAERQADEAQRAAAARVNAANDALREEILHGGAAAAHAPPEESDALAASRAADRDFANATSDWEVAQTAAKDASRAYGSACHTENPCAAAKEALQRATAVYKQSLDTAIELVDRVRNNKDLAALSRLEPAARYAVDAIQPAREAYNQAEAAQLKACSGTPTP